MALELPNAKRQTIRLSEVLGSQAYNDAGSQLTIGLGKDIVGVPVVADLAKMPHCLVAGTTGAGKSVGINAMILSLLYKAEARDVRLILIDPKMLEMSVYEGIPHLLCPVVTDMKQAANALNWGVGEMERRYKLMSKLGVRNLAGYNKKLAEAAEKRRVAAQPVQPDARVARAAGAAALHRRRHRRAGRPDDGRRQEDRGADRPPGAEGARLRHPPDPGDAAAERRRHHRPDQGQHPDPALVPGVEQDRLAAPSSTRWAPRRCSAWATCSTCPRAAACRSASTAPSSATTRCTASSPTCKSQGEPNYIDGILEGGTLDGDGDAPAGEAGGGERRGRPDVRPGGRRSSCSTAAPRSRWCSATCASATTGPPDCWNKWRNPASYPAWRPTATATCSFPRGRNDDDAVRARGGVALLGWRCAGRVGRRRSTPCASSCAT